jgi:hypothetical protein
MRLALLLSVVLVSACSEGVDTGENEPDADVTIEAPSGSSTETPSGSSTTELPILIMGEGRFGEAKLG